MSFWSWVRREFSQTGSKEEVAHPRSSAKRPRASGSFLTEILAAGPVDVVEVESQARAATLLADNKRLSHSKVFRQAREALAVKFTREGFGPGARYLLSLPGTPCAPENTMRAPFQNRAHMANPGAHGESGSQK